MTSIIEGSVIQKPFDIAEARCRSVGIQGKKKAKVATWIPANQDLNRLNLFRNRAK